MVEYTCSRLCFKADLIEPLKDNDVFVVHTPNGTFKFTKADFYRVFSNVIETKSYQEGRIYSYLSLPQKAIQFLTVPTKDLIGKEIRMKFLAFI